MGKLIWIVFKIKIHEFVISLARGKSLQTKKNEIQRLFPPVFGFDLINLVLLLVLVVNRYIAAVKPLKYLTFMKRCRVIQMLFTFWRIPSLFSLTFSLLSIRLNLYEHAMTILGYLYLLFEINLCVMLIFFLAPISFLFNLQSEL